MTDIRVLFPKICSNDFCVVKFVARELLLEIKGKHLIILLPPSLPPVLNLYFF